MMNKGIVLLSGGIDSAVTLALAKQQNQAVYALTFDYGQRHRSEIMAAKTIAVSMDVVEHCIFKLPINQFGGSALTDINSVIPQYHKDDLSPTYVPARNTVFLSIALSWAEVLGVEKIYLGSCKDDYENYPDCRPEYFNAFAKLANLATKLGVEQAANFEIITPLVKLSKAEVIQQGQKLSVDFSLTQSCYQPNEKGQACGQCQACVIRRDAFAQLDLTLS